MKCREFMDAWLDEKGIGRMRPGLLFHWVKCRRCREEVAFLRGLAQVLKKEERMDSSLAGVRREVLRAAMEEGLIARASSPHLPPRVPWRFSFSLLVVFVVSSVLLFLVMAGPWKKERPGAGMIPWTVTEGEVVISQVDDGALKKLDTTLEGAFGVDPSIAFDLTIAPWAEVVDQVSAHPYLLDSLLSRKKGEGSPPQKRGGVA